MDKYDIKSAHRDLYSGGSDFRFVDVPELHYIAANGHTEPGAAEYAAALEALYSTA